MRRLTRTILCLGVVSLAFAIAAAAHGPAPRPSVAIFFYPWYGTPTSDGAWQHWDQNAAQPPSRLPTAFYPTRGPYSSSDARLLRDQMTEIVTAGIDTVVVSWWGAGSAEAARFPAVVEAAKSAGLRVAVHLEPWVGRTAATTRQAIDALHGEGVDEFYVYDSTMIADADWATALGDLPPGVRVYANTWLVGKAAAGGFQGLYPYDVVVYSMSSFRRVCRMAHKLFGDPILLSEAILVQRPQNRGDIDPLALAPLQQRLSGVIVARDYVLMDYDIPVEQVEEASALTPGMGSSPAA